MLPALPCLEQDWLAQGPSPGAPLQRGLLYQLSKDAYLLCLVNEKSFQSICLQEGGKGGGGLDSDVKNYINWLHCI